MQENIKRFKEEGITDGTYVYTPYFSGIYEVIHYQNHGIHIDPASLLEEKDEGIEEIEESQTKWSMVKTRSISATTYFTKGKMQEIGYYI